MEGHLIIFMRILIKSDLFKLTIIDMDRPATYILTKMADKRRLFRNHCYPLYYTEFFGDKEVFPS